MRARRALLATVLIAGAGTAEARFRPRTDTDYRLVSTATNTRDGTANTFALTRVIRFARRSGGWRATVTIVPDGVHGDPRAGTIFDRAFGAMAGLPIDVTLDRTGAVTSVADAAALWERMRAGLGDDAGGGRARAMLDRLPEDRRATVLADALVALAAPIEAEVRHDGERTTTLPVARPAGDDPAVLPAREVTRVVGDRVVVDVTARDDATPDRRTSVSQHREIDRATGLALMRQQELRISMVVSGTDHLVEVRTEHRLTPMVSKYPSAKPRNP